MSKGITAILLALDEANKAIGSGSASGIKH